MLKRKITFLDSLARHSDLNVIKKPLGKLASEIYKNFQQFSTAAELKQAITKEWEIFFQNYIKKKKLFDSLFDRIFEVIKLNGKCTHF